MQPTPRIRQRTRRLQGLATRLGDLYAAVEALSLNKRRWQRQIDGVDAYVRNRERWIAHAERQIVQIRSEIEPPEAEYFGLNEEG